MKLLFERLAGSDVDFDIERAVLANVQRLVSNRSAFITDAFDVLSCGVRSIVDLGSGDRHGIERYGARIQGLIRHYEPRLQTAGVEVVGPDGGGPLHLVVSGSIETAQGPHAMRFPVQLREDG
ncbi:MAG TPA: hypothetical protein VI653_11340 [Steroidobacteraceae bacterium]